MPDIWNIAAILAKFLLYCGLTGAMGLAILRSAFPNLVTPLRSTLRKQTALLAGMSIIAAVFGFLLRGAALTGGADGMADPEMLGLLWQTPVGDALILRVVGAAMIVAGMFTPRVGQWIALAGGTCALWSFTTLGHIPEVSQTGVRALLLLHLLGVAFWIGILGPLRKLSQHPEHLEKAALLGHRFGQAAAVIVPALIVAGLIMAWLLLGDLGALISTGYGQVLLIKLALVAAILMLAAANKLRFVPAMQAGDATAAQHLVRALEIETAILLTVLAATATLTSVMTLPN